MFSKLNNAKKILMETTDEALKSIKSEFKDNNFPPLEKINLTTLPKPDTSNQPENFHASDNLTVDDLKPETINLTSPPTGFNSSLGVLNWPQVKKLDSLLNKYVPIHGRGTFPTLNVRLKDFIRNLNQRLIHQRVKIKDVRINGGVASYVLATETNYEFSDIDIIYTCDLLQLNNSSDSTPKHTTSHSLELAFSNVCDIIKQTVFECLLDHFPNSYTCKDKITIQNIKEAYVKKMVKIYQSNNNSANNKDTPDSDESLDSQQSLSRWSLISLCNDQGQNIELKFVDKMKRQFQFSVDAFQIHLNSLLSYYDCQESMEKKMMTENVYPTVLAESMYGEFEEANYHLNAKLIATKSPEEIRGGGLLKYCNLLIKGYKPICVEAQMHSMEKYMCSRFFIDFSDLNDQEHKLNAYLDCHFQNSPRMCSIYLEKLFEVVDSSTVCLMGHERKQTLNLIRAMSNRFQQQYDNASSGYCCEENDESNQSLQQVNELSEDEVIDLHGNVLNKVTDFIVDTNSNHAKNCQKGHFQDNGQCHNRNASQYYRGNHQQQHIYQHQNYLKQTQNQNQAQYFHYHNNYHHSYSNNNNKPNRYYNHNSHGHNSNHKQHQQQWYIPNQQHRGVKIIKETQNDPHNASYSFSGSDSSSLSSSPLPTNVIYVNKLDSDIPNKPKILIPHTGGVKTDTGLLFSSSAGSLTTSSGSSSVISSPSPSPSPPLTPFYRHATTEFNDETKIPANTVLTKDKESGDRTSTMPQSKPTIIHNNSPNIESSKLFQCKIPNNSYTYIEVFYNCFAPPVLPPPQQQTHHSQSPVIILYHNPSQHHYPLHQTSSLSPSPVYFYSQANIKPGEQESNINAIGQS